MNVAPIARQVRDALWSHPYGQPSMVRLLIINGHGQVFRPEWFWVKF